MGYVAGMRLPAYCLPSLVGRGGRRGSVEGSSGGVVAFYK